MHADIRHHIVQTYVNLRYGMSLTAFALPVFLVAASLIDQRYGIQNALSDYYHTPMRNMFVGALISVGVSLYLYKGFSDRENRLLNLAGLCAAGVALFPIDVPEKISGAVAPWLPQQPFTSPYLHTALALVFFALIAYVCIHCSTATVQLISDDRRRAKYLKLYRVYGVLMIVLPVGAAVLGYITVPGYSVIVAEISAIWVFAAFWLTKAQEVKRQASVLELALIVDPILGGAASVSKAQ